MLSFLVKKNFNETFGGVYFLTIRERTFNQISYSKSFSSSSLKVSNDSKTEIIWKFTLRYVFRRSENYGLGTTATTMITIINKTITTSIPIKTKQKKHHQENASPEKPSVEFRSTPCSFSTVEPLYNGHLGD